VSGLKPKLRGGRKVHLFLSRSVYEGTRFILAFCRGEKIEPEFLSRKKEGKKKARGIRPVNCKYGAAEGKRRENV